MRKDISLKPRAMSLYMSMHTQRPSQGNVSQYPERVEMKTCARGNDEPAVKFANFERIFVFI